MVRQTELFQASEPPTRDAPLAERMRPTSLEHFHGQPHLVGAGRLLHELVRRGRVESLILWGPPGCGKTTLARLLATRHGGPVVHFSAVLHGVRELRRVVEQAEAERHRGGLATVLFVDEIHRFNKAQQDAFLPHVERGTLVLLGATTENPSFELIPPLLSRTRVVVLDPLERPALEAVVHAALADPVRGLGASGLALAPRATEVLVDLARGDARVALGVLEGAADLARAAGDATIEEATVREAAQHRALAHDKAGDAHYDLLSAFIKSMRGSDPDATVYWLMRLLEGGEDPLLVARRMVVFAAEDVGLADPSALGLAVAAKDAVHFVGLPEGRIPLAAAAVHLATAPKSNAAYRAMRRALADVQRYGALPVPSHLRNAPTALMRALGHGQGYQYAHDRPDGTVEHGHLPADLGTPHYYEPTANGREATIATDLDARRRRRDGG